MKFSNLMLNICLLIFGQLMIHFFSNSVVEAGGSPLHYGYYIIYFVFWAIITIIFTYKEIKYNAKKNTNI